MSPSTQSRAPNFPPDTQRGMLRRMLTIRRFGECALGRLEHQQDHSAITPGLAYPIW